MLKKPYSIGLPMRARFPRHSQHFGPFSTLAQNSSIRIAATLIMS